MSHRKRRKLRNKLTCWWKCSSRQFFETVTVTSALEETAWDVVINTLQKLANMTCSRKGSGTCRPCTGKDAGTHCITRAKTELTNCTKHNTVSQTTMIELLMKDVRRSVKDQVWSRGEEGRRGNTQGTNFVGVFFVEHVVSEFQVTGS